MKGKYYPSPKSQIPRPFSCYYPMKQYFLIALCMLLLLTGCGSKSSFFQTFDDFSIKVYDNGKQYSKVAIDPDIIEFDTLAQLKEKTTKTDTGFINSFIIIKTVVQSGTDVQKLVESNTKKDQIKLLKYAAIENTTKNLECVDKEYSWYITAFSYQLGTGTVYQGQFFFIDDESLYVISLSSDEEQDVKNLIKSVDTITCRQ